MGSTSKTLEICEKTKTQPTEKSRMDQSKKFSKLRFLQNLGFLSRKFNNSTFQFEPSWSLRLLFLFSVVMKPAYLLKLLISCYFPQTDKMQLYIGNVFNLVPD